MIVSMTEVVPVEVENKPGGLAEVLAAIEAAGPGRRVHVRLRGARHAGARRRSSSASRIPDRALEALKAAGVRILTSEELLGSRRWPAGASPGASPRP